MEVLLLVLVVLGLPLLALAVLTLLGHGAGRLYTAVVGDGGGVEEENPEPTSGLGSSTPVVMSKP